MAKAYDQRKDVKSIPPVPVSKTEDDRLRRFLDAAEKPKK